MLFRVLLSMSQSAIPQPIAMAERLHLRSPISGTLSSAALRPLLAARAFLFPVLAGQRATQLVPPASGCPTERPMPPNQRPTPPLPAIFDRLTTPRWMPILLFWAFVLLGLSIYKLAV